MCIPHLREQIRLHILPNPFIPGAGPINTQTPRTHDFHIPRRPPPFLRDHQSAPGLASDQLMHMPTSYARLPSAHRNSSLVSNFREISEHAALVPASHNGGNRLRSRGLGVREPRLHRSWATAGDRIVPYHCLSRGSQRLRRLFASGGSGGETGLLLGRLADPQGQGQPVRIDDRAPAERYRRPAYGGDHDRADGDGLRGDGNAKGLSVRGRLSRIRRAWALSGTCHGPVSLSPNASVSPLLSTAPTIRLQHQPAVE